MSSILAGPVSITWWEAGLVALGMLGVVLCVWAMIDAAIRPDPAWKDAGQNKVLWIVLLLAALLVLRPVGILVAIAYFAVIRPKIRASQAVTKRAGDPESADPQAQKPVDGTDKF